MSQLVQRKAKDIFYLEIKEDEKKLVLAAREGRITVIIGLLSTNMLDINRWSHIDHHDDEYPEEGEYYTATPLFEAAKNGHIDTVRLLLEKGAKPNIPDEYGDSPLKAAAGKGHKEVVQMLLDIGADPNISNRRGVTPLHTASRGGHIDIVQMLLHIGADPNITNGGGGAPLSWAFINEQNDIEDVLLENGARPVVLDRPYIELKLLMAIDKGNARDVKSHLLSGVDINFGQSEPLRQAVQAGHKNIVVLLLSNGANPNHHIDHGHVGMAESPLTMALKKDKKDLVQILLDAGAEPNEEEQEKIKEWGCFDF